MEKRNTQFQTIMMQILKFGKQIHVENSEDLGADPVFCNDNILVENRFVFHKLWKDNDVYSIENILKENCSLITFKRLKEKCRNNTDYSTSNYCICTRSQQLHI